MDKLKSITAKNQRSIGSFLPGANAEKYAEPNVPRRGRPLKQHNIAVEIAVEDDLYTSVDGGNNSESSDVATTSGRSLGPEVVTMARPQTQRVRKGQSDGAWKEKQQQNPNRWQVVWAAKWPWAECVPANTDKGEIHDRARCVPCSLWKGKCETVAARAQTLKTHSESDGHKKSMELVKSQEAQVALQKLKKTGLPELFAPGNTKADKERQQQFRRCFWLLELGRPMLDYVASERDFKALGVPFCSSSYWSMFAAWEVAEALNAVVQDRIKELVQGACFLSISLDESVSIDKKSRLSLHVYVMDGWSQVPLFINVSI